jgi:hypothetical protein
VNISSYPFKNLKIFLDFAFNVNITVVVCNNNASSTWKIRKIIS